jgi:beta-lactamase superfamily II metal-dependent hydrolase
MAVKYIAEETTPLYQATSGTKVLVELLWGDRVTTLSTSGSRTKVKARGKTGYVKNAALGDQPLLELYFIDVGQGDGILIRTPDGRHIMIDGGYKRASQPSGKNAADFVDWKFVRDYGTKTIHLDAMIASHNDVDHYGGLWDLLDLERETELDASEDGELNAEAVTVDKFYHAGVGWWIDPTTGARWLGPPSADGKFLTQLMDNRASVVAALKDDADPKLQGEWAKFMSSVTKTKTSAGGATPIERLSHVDRFVPGFDGSDGAVAIRVIAPVEFELGDKPVLHRFGSQPGQNTNGNSLLLRLDYGRSRILLTGDLNTKSQQALLEDYTGERIEFLCDVAKGCHHGSADVSYEFLSAMQPAVTVICSGDAEGHDHPRPSIVAASATTGYLQITDDALVSPLVFSTELSRSVNLGKPLKTTATGPDGPLEFTGKAQNEIEVELAVTKAGDLKPTKVTNRLGKSYLVAGLIYGLVNVRTDGEKILCATLNEKSNKWETKVVYSRF